jgi:hypothetical protein
MFWRNILPPISITQNHSAMTFRFISILPRTSKYTDITHVHLHYPNMRGWKKVPGILWHRRSGATRVCTAWLDPYWSFLRARFAEVVRCSFQEAAQQVAGRDSGFCITIMRLATHRLLCSNSCHHPTAILSESRSEWLMAVLYSKNWSQGDTFHNHGGHQFECGSWTLEYYKRSLPPVIPTKAESIERARESVCVCVCVRACVHVQACARVLLWMWLGKHFFMPYHYSVISPFWELSDCPLYIDYDINLLLNIAYSLPLITRSQYYRILQWDNVLLNNSNLLCKYWWFTVIKF